MDNRLATLLTRGASLTRAEYRVLAHLTEHPLLVGNITVRELAQATFVSTATIMRLCQKLGFSGFSEFIWHCKQLLSDTPHIAAQAQSLLNSRRCLISLSPTISTPFSGSPRTNASSLPTCCARKRASFSTGPGFPICLRST
jgi:DNA-binding MurR/RpiR family transcriptional regulator